ncbi:MAG: SDR family NAD(P)-dependent oxidoreductase, partial [Pseudomonadota bacterium]
MTPRTLLVTGGNRGIGLATVKELAKNSQDTVLLACRNLKEGQKEAAKISDNVIAVQLDLSSRQ